MTCSGFAPGKTFAGSYSKVASAFLKSMLTSLTCGTSRDRLAQILFAVLHEQAGELMLDRVGMRRPHTES